MDKLKYIVFLALLMAVANGFAQTPELNEEKYWEYRDRLRQEYMLGIGPDMGMSTPAAVRDTVSGILQWTDASMDLGQYLAVLAMEYRILDKKGDDDWSEDRDSYAKAEFFVLEAHGACSYTVVPGFFHLGIEASLPAFLSKEGFRGYVNDFYTINPGMKLKFIFGNLG